MQQLKGFCLTAQLKSMSKAAKKMGLGISTISMQIKSLEDDLRIKLFKRDKKNGITLTKKGQDLYDMSIKYIYGIDNIFEKFLFVGDIHYQNEINIATNEIILSNILPPVLAKFKKKYSNIKISLHNISKEECKQQILDKQIDIGIYTFSLEEKLPLDFNIIKNKEYTLSFIVHKTNPLAKKDAKKINERDLINANFVYIPELATEEFKHFLKKYKIKNAFNITNATPEILKKLVAEDLCTAFIPEIYCNEKNKNIIIKNLQIDFGCKDFYYGIITRSDNKKDILEVFVEMFNKSVKE